MKNSKVQVLMWKLARALGKQGRELVRRLEREQQVRPVLVQLVAGLPLLPANLRRTGWLLQAEEWLPVLRLQSRQVLRPQKGWLS